MVLNTYISAEFDGLCIFRTTKLKRIAILQPHIRNFYLISIHNLLFEHTIAITDTTAISCIAECSKGIHKACCKTSQTTVTKGCIRLLVFDHVQIQSDLFQCFFYFIIECKVDQVVAQCTAHEELHGHIVYNLRI